MIIPAWIIMWPTIFEMLFVGVSLFHQTYSLGKRFFFSKNKTIKLWFLLNYMFEVVWKIWIEISVSFWGENCSFSDECIDHRMDCRYDEHNISRCYCDRYILLNYLLCFLEDIFYNVLLNIIFFLSCFVKDIFIMFSSRRTICF